MITRIRSYTNLVSCNVNVEFKVTLHEQVCYRGTLQYCLDTQLDTMVKSTMTEIVPSGTAAAMAQNEQTTEEHSTRPIDLTRPRPLIQRC